MKHPAILSAICLTVLWALCIVAMLLEEDEAIGPDPNQFPANKHDNK